MLKPQSARMHPGELGLARVDFCRSAMHAERGCSEAVHRFDLELCDSPDEADLRGEDRE